MAIQDDILNIFSTIRDAGNRATRRGEAGLAILDKLTPRERMMLSSSYSPEQYSSLEEAIMFNPLIGDQALTMYQARVGTGAEPDEFTAAVDAGSTTRPPATTVSGVPVDDLVDRNPKNLPLPSDMSGLPPDIALDTMTLPAARGLASLPPARTPAPRIPVDRIELPNSASQIPVETIERGTPIQSGGYYGEFAGTPGTGVGLNPVSDGRIPLKEVIYHENYTPLSELEAAALVASVAVGGPEMLAASAIKYLGMGARQAARMVANPATREQLRRGLTSVAEKAMGGTKQARDMAASARAARLSKPHRDFGSAGTLRSSMQKTMDAARDFREEFPGGLYNTGGPIRRMGGGNMREQILNRYNRMY